MDPALLRATVAISIGLLPVVLDTTIINIAIGTLAEQLGADVALIQWVTTGYLLALGMTVPVSAWAMSRFDGKHVWIAALLIFTAGSVLAALAWDAPSLIAFRVVQGVGGGLILPALQTLIVRAARGQNLGRAMSVTALLSALGPVLGPVVGGVLLQHSDWRSIFWINLPLGAAAVAAAFWLMPNDPPVAPRRFDALGLIILSPGIAGEIYGLSRVAVTGTFATPSVILPLVAGTALIAWFAVRAARNADEPLMDVRLFAIRSFSVATIILFLYGLILYGAMLLLPLYYQQVRGADALGAGLLLVPQGLGIVLTRPFAGRLTDRYGPRWIVFIGLVVVLAGTVPFTATAPDTPDWVFILALFVRGIGLGAVVIPVMAGVFLDLDRAQTAHGSALSRVSQQIGGSFGSAVVVVLLTIAIAARPASTTGLAAAYESVFWWTAGFTACGALTALLLPARPRSSALT
jgi:EmrB/QacA subfamily drug resistance transporter